MDAAQLADRLYAAGWRSPCDAQHANLAKLWDEISASSPLMKENACLNRRIDLLTEELNNIAKAAGIISVEAYATGPELLLICGDIKSTFQEK